MSCVASALAASCLVDIPDLASTASSGASATTSLSTGTAGKARFCETLGRAPLFCADFDEVATFDEGWSEVVLQSNGTGGAPGTLELDDSLFVSPGRSLRTRSVDPPPGCTYAKLSRQIDADVRDFRIGLSLYPRTDAVFAVATRRVSSGTCLLLVRTYDDRVELSLQVPGTSTGSILFPRPAPPRNHWSRVEVDVRLTSNPAAFAVTWEGTPLPQGTVDNVAPWIATCSSPSIDDRITFDVGVHCVGGTDPAADMSYDDVVFDTLP